MAKKKTAAPLPCPGCGRVPTIAKGKYGWVVDCINTDCPRYLAADALALTEERAIEKWNEEVAKA
jgi:hypothetical protein